MSTRETTSLPDDLFDDLQSRVAAGAALLDEHVPDWRERVDPGSLVMNDCNRCVCGQLFADIAEQFDYDSGYEYGLLNLLGYWSRGEARDLGFDLPVEYAFMDYYTKWVSEAWEAMADLWTKEIQR